MLRRRWNDGPLCPFLLQRFFDQHCDLRFGQSSFGSETNQIFFLVYRENSAGESKLEIFLEFGNGCFMLLRSQLFVQRLASVRVEQLNSRFGQKSRRFLQPRPEHLRQWITWLILERQFLLPPPHQFTAMLLNQLVTWIRVRIETKPFVRIGRTIIIPSLPFSGVVREWKRKAYVALGHRLADVQLAQARCCGADIFWIQTGVTVDGDLRVVAGRFDLDLQYLVG